MSILSSLFNLIKKIIKKVVDFVKKVIKKYWPVLLILAAIYFAPVIGSFLATNGFAGLGSVFSSVGSTVTPFLTDAIGWVGSSASSLGSNAWQWFKGLEFGTQASVVLGASALLAPEETADLLGEVAETAWDTAGTVLGAIVDSVASSPAVWIVGGGLLLLWFLSNRRRSDG